MLVFAVHSTTGCDDPDGVRDLEAFEDDGDPEEIKDGDVGGLQQAVRVDNNTGGCTGILLNQSTLLTAAHCVSPVTQIEWMNVDGPGLNYPRSIDRGRIWVYDPYFETTDGNPPSEKYDIAVVALIGPISELTTDRGTTLATVGSIRPDDGSSLWLNGRMDNGVSSPSIMRHATTLEPLPTSDSRYPYQLLDTKDAPMEAGDSGGPLFRERAGEDNDGRGGTIAPVVYGLVSRGGSYARLDPVKSWIDQRAADAARSHEWATGDWEWALCSEDKCPVWMTSDLDGTWEFLDYVPRETRMGVFVQRGDTLVVSYPMADRGRKVQVINRSGWRFGGLQEHGPPPAEDLRIEDRYCTSAICMVYARRDLLDGDETAIGEVPCGTRMGVFVNTAQWAVVSYPMNDRSRAVQIVPRNGGGWSSSASGC